MIETLNSILPTVLSILAVPVGIAIALALQRYVISTIQEAFSDEKPKRTLEPLDDDLAREISRLAMGLPSFTALVDDDPPQPKRKNDELHLSDGSVLDIIDTDS